jgi:cytidyltransferase-like protein
MKSFFQFLSESAAQQAARLGLKGDGHGGWYDRSTGEFVAKTEKGRLKFYNKRQKVGGRDPEQTELEKNISDPNFNDPSVQQQVPQEVPQEEQPQLSPEEQEQLAAQQAAEMQAAVMSKVQSPDLAAGPPPVPKTKGTLTIAFGRFNPPHAGHLQLMDTAASSAEQEKSDYLIVPSRSNDPKKNPLDPDTKVSMMRQLFPQHAARIQNDQNTRTIFDILKKAHNDGYTNVRIVGGADRVNEFNKLANNYNGSLYQFDNVEVISSGDRDPDAEGVEGLSASRMRLAVAENDFKTYYDHLHKEEPMLDQETGEPMMQTDPETGEFLTDPETGEMIPAMQKVPLVSRSMAKQMFADTRASMGINEEWGIWEMAPKFDQQTLRENYVSDAIFKIGQLVENMNTGLVGRIIRRGANHLICVTEDNIMFKSWIKDVNEAVVNGTTRSGVPANQRLVGTDAHVRYVASMVPGSSWGLQFINKYRKKVSL